MSGYNFERFQADIRVVRASSGKTAEGMAAAIWREFESLRAENQELRGKLSEFERVASAARALLAHQGMGTAYYQEELNRRLEGQ